VRKSVCNWIDSCNNLFIDEPHLECDPSGTLQLARVLLQVYKTSIRAKEIPIGDTALDTSISTNLVSNSDGSFAFEGSMFDKPDGIPP